MREDAPPARPRPRDLQDDPASPGHQAALREHLAKLLQEQPGLLDELRALLPAQPAGDTLTQHLAAGAKGAQVKGDSNTITIG
jgi:hypothetical protein